MGGLLGPPLLSNCTHTLPFREGALRARRRSFLFMKGRLGGLMPAGAPAQRVGGDASPSNGTKPP